MNISSVLAIVGIVILCGIAMFKLDSGSAKEIGLVGVGALGGVITDRALRRIG